MKTLVIHPEDPTTTFISPIYAPLRNKTVITGSVSKSELQELIECHDRVIMLGHGAPFGLINPEQFPDAGQFIVGGSMTSSLKNKSNCIYIWCYADQFVTRYGLSGLCSGMFISEEAESVIYGFEDVDLSLINQSNEGFACILSKYIHEPVEILYEKLLFEYGILAENNVIASFNLKRLYLIQIGLIINHYKTAV